MIDCACQEAHARKRIVLTGGPGAGKTAVLELIKQHFCRHVVVLPEAAGIVLGGGFPRQDAPPARRAAQRAIFAVQRQLEQWADEATDAAIVLCDRGTLDGLAYWPGAPEELLAAAASSRAAELVRYDAIIHLRTPTAALGYDHRNALRVETAERAAEIDAGIAAAWDGHPRRFFVDSTQQFLDKAAAALAILRRELPPCCREHLVPEIDGRRSGGGA